MFLGFLQFLNLPPLLCRFASNPFPYITQICSIFDAIFSLIKKSTERTYFSLSVFLDRFDIKVLQIFPNFSFMFSCICCFGFKTEIWHPSPEDMCLQFSFSFYEGYLALQLPFDFCLPHFKPVFQQ